MPRSYLWKLWCMKPSCSFYLIYLNVTYSSNKFSTYRWAFSKLTSKSKWIPVTLWEIINSRFRLWRKMNQINLPKNIFCWWITPPTSEYEASESLVVLGMKSHKYPMILKKKKNFIPKLGIQILYLIFTLLKGSGSFEVLWEVGCLTAAQPHTLGLIGLFCWVSLHNFTVFLVQLVDVWVYKNFPFHPAWLEPEVEWKQQI